MRRTIPLAVLLLLAAACGDDPPDATAGNEPATTTSAVATEQVRYTVTSTVMEAPGRGLQLCLGGIAESYPPQCGGLELVGWDWDAVDGEESASGSTWGSFTVVGTYDDETQTFTLTEPPRAPEPVTQDPDPGVDISTPCPLPDSGWHVVDPATATDAAMSAAIQHARAQPDVGGVWVDQSINPAADAEVIDEMAMNDPQRLVLNISFTGDLERHEAEIREIWGGALCVSEAPRSAAELERIVEELVGDDDRTYWWIGVSETEGVVNASVTVDDGLQSELDARYGEGVVVITPQLNRVD